jgi:hypothetical protein
MGIFGVGDEDFARTNEGVAGGHFGVEGIVGLGVEGGKGITQLGKGFPPNNFGTCEWYVDVDVFLVDFKLLLMGSEELRIAHVDVELLPLKVNAPSGCACEIVLLEICEYRFEKRVEGEAAAGAPIAAVPQDDMTVSVPEKYLDERYFIVRARGNSMIDAGIRSGSCCVFARDAYVDSGVIALVQVEGPTDQPEGTIKRVYFSGDRVELRPENPEYQSMFYPADAVRVSGVLVKVLE